MEYTISKTKRNLIIFSAAFLILKAMIITFTVYALDPKMPNLALRGIDRLLQIIAYGFIMIVLADYFSHNKLKALQIITLGILAFDIIGSIIQFSFQAGMNTRSFFSIGNGIIWTLAMITWIIFLFRISAKNLRTLTSIRKYVISIVVVILLGGILPILVGKIMNTTQYLGIIFTVLGVFPYFFIIEFGLKLPLKE